MDREILGEERLTPGRVAAVVAFIALVMGLYAAYFAVRAEDLGVSVAVPIIIFVVTLAVMVLIAVALDRPTALASRGPYSRGQVYTQAPPAVVVPALMAQLQRSAVIVEESGGSQVSGRKKVNWLSWGTRVFVDQRASVDYPGLGVVTVAVRPSYPLQLTDWGQSVKLVEKILRAVPGGMPASAMPQHPRSPIQQPHH